MANYSYDWDNVGGNCRRSTGMDVLDMLNKKIDYFANKVNEQVKSGSFYSQVCVVICAYCGGYHNSYECFNCRQIQYDDNY